MMAKIFRLFLLPVFGTLSEVASFSDADGASAPPLTSFFGVDTPSSFIAAFSMTSSLSGFAAEVMFPVSREDPSSSTILSELLVLVDPPRRGSFGNTTCRAKVAVAMDRVVKGAWRAAAADSASKNNIGGKRMLID